MKIIYCLLILAFSTIGCQSSLAQVRFGVKAGCNASTLSYSSSTSGVSTRLGISLGGYADLKIKGRFHFQPEINYSSQGAKENVTFSDPYGQVFGTYKFTSRINYLNVPFIFKMDLGKIVNLQLGPQVGIFLNAKSISSGGSSNVKGYYKSDFGVVGGIGFNIGKHFNVGTRINYGLTSISKSGDIRNIVGSIFGGFTF